MRRWRSGFYLLALVVLLTGVSACGRQEQQDMEPVVDAESVQLLSRERTEPLNFVTAQKLYKTEQDAYTENTVIVSGTVTKVEEAVLKYDFMGSTVEDEVTFFELKIDKVFCMNTDALEGKTSITVGTVGNSHYYIEGMALIQEGQEAVIFGRAASEIEEDLIGLDRYVDCWMNDIEDLFLEKAGDGYVVTDQLIDGDSGYQSLISAAGLCEEDLESIYGHEASDEAREKISGKGAEALSAYMERFPKSYYFVHLSGDDPYFVGEDELEKLIRDRISFYAGKGDN